MPPIISLQYRARPRLCSSRVRLMGASFASRAAFDHFFHISSRVRPCQRRGLSLTRLLFRPQPGPTFFRIGHWSPLCSAPRTSMNSAGIHDPFRSDDLLRPAGVMRRAVPDLRVPASGTGKAEGAPPRRSCTCKQHLSGFLRSRTSMAFRAVDPLGLCCSCTRRRTSSSFHIGKDVDAMVRKCRVAEVRSGENNEQGKSYARESPFSA